MKPCSKKKDLEHVTCQICRVTPPKNECSVPNFHLRNDHTRWHAFKVVARNNFGLRQPKWTIDTTFQRSHHRLCRNVICAFLNNKEKTWDSIQNEAGDSFFLERPLFLAENLISPSRIHQNLFFLAGNKDREKRKLFIITKHTLFSTMRLP